MFPTVDILLLLAALVLAILGLAKQSVQYTAVALLLVVVDLLIHVIPK